MCPVLTLTPTWNQSTILNQLKLSPQSSPARHLTDHWLELTAQALRIIDPMAVFEVFPSATAPALAVPDCSHVVACFCTCGDAQPAVQALFDDDNYLDSYILHHLITTALFDISNQLETIIAKQLAASNLTLGCRYSPGDDDLPLYKQADVLAVLSSITPIPATLTEGDMLSPVDSMLYYYGADAHPPKRSQGHNCQTCSRQDCPFRAS